MAMGWNFMWNVPHNTKQLTLCGLALYDQLLSSVTQTLLKLCCLAMCQRRNLSTTLLCLSLVRQNSIAVVFKLGPQRTKDNKRIRDRLGWHVSVYNYHPSETCWRGNQTSSFLPPPPTPVTMLSSQTYSTNEALILELRRVQNWMGWWGRHIDRNVCTQSWDKV